MAIDDLSILRKELPEIFDEKPIPEDWQKDWIIVKVNDPEELISVDLVDDFVARDENYKSVLSNNYYGGDYIWVPIIKDKFPGAPMILKIGEYLPPPDALAFYLPFHSYYPDWWGIYLTFEGVRFLAWHIREYSQNRIGERDSLLVSQVFLYCHEYFHHLVECFATRMEIFHRTPMYKKKFLEIYLDFLNNPEKCENKNVPSEEALADAYALVKIHRIFNKKKHSKLIMEALVDYLSQCPPCYAQALHFFPENIFKLGRCYFAEYHHKKIFSSFKDHKIWLLFPHAFSGIARVSSRVNYIINVNSPLSKRLKLNLRYLTHFELRKKLRKLADCDFVRPGKGSHEIWKSPSGKKFPVPIHPRDLSVDVLRRIIKQAGLNMSVKEFIQAKV